MMETSLSIFIPHVKPLISPFNFEEDRELLVKLIYLDRINWIYWIVLV